MLDHVGGSKAISMPLPSDIADHQAAAIGRPVAIHQLDVVSPAGVHVWPGVLGGETASQTSVCEAPVSPAGVHVWPGVLGGETASQTSVCEAHVNSVIVYKAGCMQGKVHIPQHTGTSGGYKGGSVSQTGLGQSMSVTVTSLDATTNTM